MSRGRTTATARIFAPACETTWPMSYRSSICGLTISARCPAISARRSRRMSSSLLPLNIGPQTTSSHPPRSGNNRITRGTLVRALDGLEGPACEQPQADDPERTTLLDDRQVAEVVVEHDPRGVLDRRLRLDRHRVDRHPLPNARLGGASALGHRAQEVALRDDADDAHHVLEDDDRADVGGVHLLRRLADGVRRLNRQHV